MSKEHPEIFSTFLAKYAGTCVICTLAIEVGQIVHGRSDGSYVHVVCHDAVVSVTPSL